MSLTLPYPTLIIVTGWPGPAKNEIGELLSQQLRVPLLHKNEILTDLAGDPANEQTGARTLEEMADEALLTTLQERATSGKSLVVVSHFTSSQDASLLQRLSTSAKEKGLKLVQVYCACDHKVAAQNFDNTSVPKQIKERLETYQGYEDLYTRRYRARLSIGVTLVIKVSEILASDMAGIPARLLTMLSESQLQKSPA